MCTQNLSTVMTVLFYYYFYFFCDDCFIKIIHVYIVGKSCYFYFLIN